MKALTPQLKYAQVFYLAGNSFDKEISRSVSNDIYLIAISIAVFIFVAVVAMSR